MSWSTVTNSSQITLTSNWQSVCSFKISEIQTSVVQVESNFQPDSIDNSEVRILTSLDGTNWDTVPFLQATLNNSDNVALVSFNLEKYPWFKVEGRCSGSTDTSNTMKANYVIGG